MKIESPLAVYLRAASIGGVETFTEEDVMAALSKMGLNSVQDLAHEIWSQAQNKLGWRDRVQSKNAAVPVREVTNQRRGKPRRSKVPIKFGNVVYDPKDIGLLLDAPLAMFPARQQCEDYIIAVKRDELENITRAFRNLFEVPRHVEALGDIVPLDLYYPPPPPPQVGQVGQGGCSGYSGTDCQNSSTSAPAREEIQILEDAEFNGDWMWAGAGDRISDLTDVPRGTVLFFSGDWNDTISSFKGFSKSITYFEHDNFEGDTFNVGPNMPISNLEQYGWNDRISSLIVSQ